MTYSSIIDNSEGNLLIDGLEKISENCTRFDIASAFFSLDALGMLAERIQNADRIRLLFGDDAAKSDRLKLLSALRERSDIDLAAQRSVEPTLTNLQKALDLIKAGKFEARCYTKKKFHAKVYIAERPHDPTKAAIMGSGNFTRWGLTRNIELNARMTEDQAVQLESWFQERWDEAKTDDVTEELKIEIHRQVDIYSPYAIFLRSLLAWGDWHHGREDIPRSKVQDTLDPHQNEAFRQAVKLIERFNGVMVCDGVGLGKSFVALALMEHFLAQGKRTLLVAPKSIIASSWDRYLTQYLDAYRGGFASLIDRPMTWFGFAPEDWQKKIHNPEDRAVKLAELKKLAGLAEVVIIDESHNFRTPNVQRYRNMLSFMKPQQFGTKRVILLTATPYNTKFTDLSSQFQLITGEGGAIGEYTIDNLRKAAGHLDRFGNQPKTTGTQAALFGNQSPEDQKREQTIQNALSLITIQRSRAMCQRIAAKAGKELRFPERMAPQEWTYKLSPKQKDLVKETEREFTELAAYLQKLKVQNQRATKQDKSEVKPGRVKPPIDALSLVGYLPDQFRKQPVGIKEAYTETQLATLVFRNAMKQFESSVTAFGGILQTIGAGLSARLLKAFPEDAEVIAFVESHREWINTPFPYGVGLPGDIEPDDETDLPEMDDEEDEDDAPTMRHDRIENALRSPKVRKFHEQFSPETHRADAWRGYVQSDIDRLQTLWLAAEDSQKSDVDEKLNDIATIIERRLQRGERVLLFTESVRTSQYLHHHLRNQFEAYGVERIDSHVKGDARQSILNAFAPLYNPLAEGIKPRPPVHLLICTDVLAEGVNLQETHCILNYDIHWNPTRLIQRIGRVDRRLANDDREPRKFDIINVFPPKEVEDILKLVGVVEHRKFAITRMLGLDQAFLNSTDEAGTLKEFNAMIDGEITTKDEYLLRYRDLLDSEEFKKIATLPEGALGSWPGSGHVGLFGLFRLQRKSSTKSKSHADLVGQPIFCLKLDGKVITNPIEVLTALSSIKPNIRPREIADTEQLVADVVQLTEEALQPFMLRQVTSEFELKPICFMEITP